MVKRSLFITSEHLTIAFHVPPLSLYLFMTRQRRCRIVSCPRFSRPKSTMKKELILRGVGLASIVAGAIALSSCGKKEDSEQAKDDVKVLRITAIPDKKVSDQSIKYKALSDYPVSYTHLTLPTIYSV